MSGGSPKGDRRRTKILAGGKSGAPPAPERKSAYRSDGAPKEPISSPEPNAERAPESGGAQKGAP